MTQYQDLLLTSVHESIDYTNKVDRNACQGLTLSLPLARAAPDRRVACGS